MFGNLSDKDYEFIKRNFDRGYYEDKSIIEGGTFYSPQLDYIAYLITKLDLKSGKQGYNGYLYNDEKMIIVDFAEGDFTIEVHATEDAYEKALRIYRKFYTRENLDESNNPLKDATKFAKKHQKGLGAFVKLNAGDVEKGIETFNKNMGNVSSAGETQGGSMSESKNLKEAQNKRLPAWSKESAEATNNSFDEPQSVDRVISSFNAENAKYTQHTWDSGAVVAKYLFRSEDTIDVSIPKDAYVVIDWNEGTYPVPIAVGCYAWDGRFWYYIDFEDEDIIPDDYFEHVSNSGSLANFLDDRIYYSEDEDDLDSVLSELEDEAHLMKYDDIQEIRNSVENKRKELNDSSLNKDIEENIKSPVRINIREKLIEMDIEDSDSEYLNSYEAAALSIDEKKELARMLADPKITRKEVKEFLFGKLTNAELEDEILNNLTEDATNTEEEYFTPEEQYTYNIDEEGFSLDSYDQYHHCAWCEEVVADARKELNMGWLCPDCISAIKSRGEKLAFEE